MRVDVLTLFPEMFEAYLASSIVGRARAKGVASISCTNFRDFAQDRHRSVDDRPFGGGPGMVLSCEPVFRAVEHVESQAFGAAISCGAANMSALRADMPPTQDMPPVGEYVEAQASGRPLRILLSPQGERLTQATVASLASEPWLMLVCGHYEGFDERIREGLGAREISIGDYVLSGGEPAAMVLIDAMVRLLPGALGDAESPVEESFSAGTLEYPHYTRPREFRGMTVPEVLLSGDHAKIAEWRREQSLLRTAERRPDLLDADGVGRAWRGAADQASLESGVLQCGITS